jgi:integrase
MTKRRRGNGEGSIFQRAGRTGWFAAVTQNGRRKTYHDVTRQGVARQLAAALAAKERGQLVTTASQPLGDYLTSTWLEQFVRPSVRPRTFISYEAVLRLHIVPRLGKTRLDRLAPAQVQQLLNDKLASGLSPRSVDYIRQVLKTALAKAIELQLISRNVAKLASVRVETREVQPFTPVEARAFLAAVRGDHLEALYGVALAVGLRQGEALGLRWSDVDLDDGLIHVRYQLQRLDGRLQLRPVKTDKSRRTVALPASIVSKLQEHRRRQLAERPAIGDGYVFASVDGSPLDAGNVRRAYKAVLRAAGLPDKRFHDLRHATATLLLIQGTPMRVVMALLGHSQISLTMDLYSHVLPELRREAADRMEAILQG